MAEAKDIIYSALYGLILALSTWIIVSTINPDLLYLKKPGASPVHQGYSCLPSGMACDPLTDCCNYGACGDFIPNICPEKLENCYDPTTPSEGYSVYEAGVKVMKCKCINGIEIDKGGATDCDNACLNNYDWGWSSCVKIKMFAGFGPDSIPHPFDWEGGNPHQYSFPTGTTVYYRILIDDPRKVLGSAVPTTLDCNNNGTIDTFCLFLDCDSSKTSTKADGSVTDYEWILEASTFEDINGASFNYTYNDVLTSKYNQAKYVIKWDDGAGGCVGSCIGVDKFRFKVEDN